MAATIPLPEETQADLQRLYAAVTLWEVRRLHTPERQAFGAFVTALWTVGWTLQSIGDAIGKSRQAIHQTVHRGPYCSPWPLPEVPPVPVPEPPPPPPPPPPVPTLSAELAHQLRELQELASKCTRGRNEQEGAMTPARHASETLSQLMYEVLETGVPLDAIAAAAGVLTASARYRLRRHGYRGTTSRTGAQDNYMGRRGPIAPAQ